MAYATRVRCSDMQGVHGFSCWKCPCYLQAGPASHLHAHCCLEPLRPRFAIVMVLWRMQLLAAVQGLSQPHLRHMPSTSKHMLEHTLQLAVVVMQCMHSGAAPTSAASATDRYLSDAMSLRVMSSAWAVHPRASKLLQGVDAGFGASWHV